MTAGTVPVREVGAMHSQYRGLTVEQAYLSCRYDELEQEYAQARGYASAEAYQAALAAHIAVHGMCVPVAFKCIGGGYLSNGHHRYFAARDLGWERMPAVPYDDSPVPFVDGWDRVAAAVAS